MRVCSAAGLAMRLQPGRGVLCRSGTQEPGRVYKDCFAFCGKRSSVPCVALSLFLRKKLHLRPVSEAFLWQMPP